MNAKPRHGLVTLCVVTTFLLPSLRDLSAAGRIYWIELETQDVWYSDLDVPEPRLFEAPFTAPQALAVDMVARKLYWTDQIGEQRGAIRRANLFDGSEPETVLELGGTVSGIAVGSRTRRLFFGNKDFSLLDPEVGIWEAQLGGGAPWPTARTQDTEGLFLDETRARLYQLDLCDNGIGAYTLEGQPEPFASEVFARGLAVDPVSGRVFWSGSGSPGGGSGILVSKADGSDSKLVIAESGEAGPWSWIALDSKREQLYLSRADRRGIDRVGVDGLGLVPFLPELPGRAAALVVVEDAVSPPGSFVRGDANQDGALDLGDPVSILLHLFGGRLLSCVVAADATDDELVSLTDALYALEYLFRGGPAPPSPFPGPGLDPTPGPLACRGELR